MGRVGGAGGAARDHSKDTKAMVAKTLRLISQHKQGDELTFDNPADKRRFVQHMDAYETALRRANAVDFDDLLALPVAIFREHPRELQRWRDQFTQVGHGGSAWHPSTAHPAPGELR
jgi:superfamily I DNA/RNA helicase